MTSRDSNPRTRTHESRDTPETEGHGITRGGGSSPAEGPETAGHGGRYTAPRETEAAAEGLETAGHTMRQFRLGLPMTAFSEAVLAARDAGEERLYLEVPLDLVQAALRTASPEVAGHSAVGSSEGAVVLELEDTDFDVAGVRAGSY